MSSGDGNEAPGMMNPISAGAAYGVRPTQGGPYMMEPTQHSLPQQQTAPYLAPHQQQLQYQQQARQHQQHLMQPAPTVASGGAERATQLFAVCESCLIVLRISGYDMSYRRILERKCSRCAGMVTLPQEIMEMLILYGHFIPERVAAAIAIGATVTHPSLRADFVATAMNELLVPLQTDFVYDIALPKRRDGLGMSLRMHKGDLIVGGFIDFEDGSESPSVAARIISVGDILVAINKKSITSSSFEKNIRMLSHAASPVYLTFRRSRPVSIL